MTWRRWRIGVAGVVVLALASTLGSTVALATGRPASAGGEVAAPSTAPASRLQPARTTSRARRAARPTTLAATVRHRTPRGVSALAADLGALVHGHTRRGSWGVLVVSLSRGDTLFAHAADAAMVPASTMKLFTAALALEALGPAHSFQTQVLRDGALGTDGVVRGHLILRGDGDPALSPRFVRGGADAPMALLAQLTAGAGVRRVTGDLVADASAFEPRGIPEGWLTRYAGASYAAPFSALSLNENLVVVRVTPGAPGAPPAVAFEPATDGLEVVNTAVTVSGAGGRLAVYGTPDDRILVSGTVGARSAARRSPPQLLGVQVDAFAVHHRHQALQGGRRQGGHGGGHR